MKKYKRYLEKKFGKKGFTLIELLAIILVLAILALIVIPFITKIVEEASKEAFRQTTKGTATAIENKCDLDVINDDKIIDTYAIEKSIVTIGGKINVNAKLPLYANANVNQKCNVQIAAHNKKWCAIKSYDADKVTVTIFAKGKDSVVNEIIVTEKLLNLDLNMPTKPVIVSNSGYPVLTSYGVRLDDITTVTYGTRKDIDNYYSVDGGTTWLPYTGTVNLSSGTIIAKSVKKNSGLEVSTSKTVSMPAGAVPLAGYDGNDSTYYKKTLHIYLSTQVFIIKI